MVNANLAHTSVSMRDGTIYVQYYNTILLTFCPENGFLTLNSGGFNTASTVNRMNAFLSKTDIRAHVRRIKGKIVCELIKPDGVLLTLPLKNNTLQMNVFTGEEVA